MLKYLLMLIILFMATNCRNLAFRQDTDSNENKQCSGVGFFYAGQCYCPTNYMGDNCENESTELFLDLDDKCDDLINRLDFLFNLSPQTYIENDDDFQFKRYPYQQSIGTHSQIQPISNIIWFKMHQATKEFKIFDDKIYVKDIKQSDQVINNFFFAALASIVNIRKGKEIRNMFMTQKDTAKNVYVIRWIIDGKPRIVAIDDFIPGKSSQTNIPLYGQVSQNMNFWPIILEKSWAKIHGTYANTYQGEFADIWKALTNAPVYRMQHQKFDYKTIYKSIEKFLQNGWAVGAKALQNSKYLLSEQLGISVLKTFEIKPNNEIGTVPQKLVLVFDPTQKYEKHLMYGQWNYQSKFWNEYTKNQTNFEKFQNHKGTYILTSEEYKILFDYTTWAEVQQDYETSYIEVPFQQNNQEESQVLQFQLDNSASGKDISISFEKTKKSLIIKDCQPPFQHKGFITYMDDMILPTHEKEDFKISDDIKQFTKAQPGIYNIRPLVVRNQQWIKSYIISVYAPKGSVKWITQFDNVNIKKDTCSGCYNHGRCNMAHIWCTCYRMYGGSRCKEEEKCKKDSDCGFNAKCWLWGSCWCDRKWKGRSCSVPS